MHAVPPQQTARVLGLYSLETGYPCMILDGQRHISTRMPAWMFLHVCRSVWSLAFPSPEASEPCLGPLPLACSHLRWHMSFSFKKKKGTHKNKWKSQRTKLKNLPATRQLLYTETKQNQCSKKATDFPCSISQVTHDHRAPVAFCLLFVFFLLKKESESERKRNKASRDEER